MRRTPIAAAVLGGTLLISAVSEASAYADVSPTQQLPSAACNSGTMNAHSSVPETTGSGTVIFAHNAIPGTANVTPCGHGG